METRRRDTSGRGILAEPASQAFCRMGAVKSRDGNSTDSSDTESHEIPRVGVTAGFFIKTGLGRPERSYAKVEVRGSSYAQNP